MRFLFSTLFAIVMAASLQAVSVAWTVPNSDWNLWNWATNNSKEYDINVYVFFSAKDFSAEDAAAYVTAKDTTAVNANYAPASQFGTSKTTPLNIWANNLNPGNATGYYYMVVFENNVNTSKSYAVAQTTEITVSNSTNLGQGVYNTASGSALDPNGIEYFDGLAWLDGSTWFAPMAPEPTVMALLALGVASLALRRKIS